MGRTIRVVLLALALTALVSGAPAAADSVDSATVRVDPRPGRVALTFDDGPHPVWTPVILDILDSYDVTATFFITGFRAEQYPEIVAEIVRRGHSVQPHGYAHARMAGRGITWTTNDLQTNIDQIVAAGAPQPSCFRPPYGAVNQRLRDVAAGLGLATVLWDVDSGDYAHSSTTLSVSRVLTGLEDGDVILMHDLYGFIHDESLPQIIEGIRARGLRFDTICDDRPVQRLVDHRPVRISTRPI